jgi:hypothetical protein
VESRDPTHWCSAAGNHCCLGRLRQKEIERAARFGGTFRVPVICGDCLELEFG